MNKYVRPVTPAEVSKSIQKLCAEIVNDATPFHVDVLPNHGEPANECFNVVRRQVDKLGGESIVGWSIWEVPTVFVEAEFHAVWRSPSGEYIDITSKNNPTNRILFLPDPFRTYDGRSVNNIRRPISGEPVLLRFFGAFDRKYELLNRGARANEHGELKLEGSEAQEYHAIENDLAELSIHVLGLYPQVGLYMPCLCGSGKKVKWCHGVT
jgi:hypothetical protein